MQVIRQVEVVDRPLDLAALQNLVADRAAGAVVSFCGDVRDNDHGRAVRELTYEGHPSAARVLAEVAQEVADRHDLIGLAVAHRVGPIPIGESALIAVVSSRHRDVAFAACADLVDLTKERIPVWKHQVFADGTDEWVNCA
jgi:molybdopterin synthase catalytic subunit